MPPKSPKGKSAKGKSAKKAVEVEGEENKVVVVVNKDPADPSKNPDHRGMQEILNKGAAKREYFQGRLMDFTRERNPLLGEETYRENPEYLVHSRYKNSSMDNTFQNLRYQGNRVEPLGSKIGLVNSLRRRKEILEGELSQTRKILEHKRLCLSLTSEFSKHVTLHPALAQSTQVGGSAEKDREIVRREDEHNRERRGNFSFFDSHTLQISRQTTAPHPMQCYVIPCNPIYPLSHVALCTHVLLFLLRSGYILL